MKRAEIIFVPLVLLVLCFWLWRRSHEQAIAQGTKGTQATDVRVTSAPPPRQKKLLGETILRDYASTNHPPENDLTLMSHLMENSLLLLKSSANRPLSANEDWAACFRGQNIAHERFLSDTHAALNAQGQLVDRWGTPLFFHALGGGRYELRSAGPDKKLWTADDIHQNPDGSFRHGGDLNPSSLFDATNRHSPR